jgi:hypothetical protein
MNTSDARRIFSLLCIGCASMTLGLDATQASAAHTIQAVWKVQHVTLSYRAVDSAYTCAALLARLRSILLHLGAHEAITIAVRGCDEPGGFGTASITLASPIEATVETLDQLTRHDAKSELIARLRGITPDSAELLPRFPAVWKTISFANALHLRLSPADCHLLGQLRREILPKLSIRIIEDEIRCSTTSVIRPRLTVAALVASH